MGKTSQEKLFETIRTIEKAYEYMLTYAAQGKRAEESQGGVSLIRQHMEELSAGLENLSGVIADNISDRDETFSKFHDLVISDSRKAGCAVNLVLSRSSISSHLVDNLNASIHLRALLTDLFLLDEVLKASQL